MPHSIQFNSRWRLILLAFILIAPLFVPRDRVDAQRRRPVQSGTSQVIADATQPQKKNLTRVSSSETPEGSSIMVFSDLPLNDYSAYRGGDRFYVLIPGADASRVATSFRGRGFTDVRAQKRGSDVLLSFRLLAGATARVNQKFNRIEIVISVPALVAANAAANTNRSTGTQTDPSGGTRNTNVPIAVTRTPSGTGTSVGNSGTSSSSGGTSQGTRSGRRFSGASGQGYSELEQETPNDSTQTAQTETTQLPPDTHTTPIVMPSVTPTAEQIAQAQPSSGVPGMSEPAPPATIVAPSTDTSFGAQVKQNWLIILLAVAVVGLISWVLFARSRADDDLVERRIDAIRESRATVAREPKPRVVREPKVGLVRPPVAEVSGRPAADAVLESVAEAEVLSVPSVTEVVPPLEVLPEIVEAVLPVTDGLAAPVLVAADLDSPVLDDTVQEVIVEEEIEPAKPIAVEQATIDVASLLAGESYNEAAIGTQNFAARQMVAAELLAALSGRKVARRERARDAFIKHGYFDDATRTLRTAESPGERASAARSLGLIRDDSGTPHLVAALEDSSPEVRRAAVESLAEVRDPAAVASLEALRDREKSRKVPKSLIQHAIEASVVGKIKTVLPSSEELSNSDEPLGSNDFSSTSFDSASPLNITDEHVALVQSDDDLVLEMPVTPDASEVAELADAGVIDVEQEDMLLEETPLGVAEEVATPVVMEEPVIDQAEGTSHEWVDIDVSRPSRSRRRQPQPSVADDEEVTASLVEDVPAEPVAIEVEPEAVEPVTEAVSETGDGTLLPFEGNDAVIADVDADDLAGSATSVLEEASELGIDEEPRKEIEFTEANFPGLRAAIVARLDSEDANERAAAVEELGRIGGDESFEDISSTFDDPSPDVRNAAARALFRLNPDRAGSFTRALREASPERRRHIGAALSSSGLATEAIGDLMGEGREKTYDAFSLLFLMSKAGEVQPLMHAVEEHPNNEVRLAVVKLLALSGQQEILPAFRRLAVRGSLPTEVRSAVMEAIYQLSSQT